MAKRVGTSPWSPWIVQWKQQQEALRVRLKLEPIKRLPRFIAGVDAAFSRDKKSALSAAVVWDRQDQCVVEVAHAICPVEVPYIPGYLAFREGPVVTQALAGLKHPYGVVMFDGQGYAHPRRCGLACFVGISQGLRAIGVGKSRLIGTHDDPPMDAGNWTPLMDHDEQVGVALRTKAGSRPIYVSVGHRVTLDSAIELVLACCLRYRIPEPTRHADREVAALKRSLS